MYSHERRVRDWIWVVKAAYRFPMRLWEHSEVSLSIDMRWISALFVCYHYISGIISWMHEWMGMLILLTLWRWFILVCLFFPKMQQGALIQQKINRKFISAFLIDTNKEFLIACLSVNIHSVMKSFRHLQNKCWKY